MNYNEFLDKVKGKLSYVTDEIDFYYPYVTKDGLYKNAKPHPYSWITGFYGGILWYMYMLTEDEKYLVHAKKAAERFDEALMEYKSLSHDVGFQFLHTSVADYQITGDEASRVRALHAATILAGRYNPNGRFIRAWNDDISIFSELPRTGYAIIDCMMNIPLLYWASEVTNDPRFRQTANNHADTVINTFIRDDGSVNHIVIFDPETGEVLQKPAGQGFAEGSSWTRGQAWAIHGFATAYHYTKETRYLDAAKKIANYFADCLTDDFMPIDFRQPSEPKCADCSAAAIAASGYLELLKYCDDEKFRKAVDRLMNLLYKNCDFTHNTQSILQNCSELYHNKSGWHRDMIYGDFYMLEALVRLCGGDVLYY